MATIRRATVDDVEELLQLRLKLSRETGDLRRDDPAREFIEGTRSYLLDTLPTGRFLAWVAEIERRIIATSGLVFFEKPPTAQNLAGLEAYVMNMYTLPEWRGQGIATSLMQEIIRYVKTTSARRIWLRTTRDGQHVYEHSGFRFTEGDMELVW